jgi:hypothetical protein
MRPYPYYASDGPFRTPSFMNIAATAGTAHGSGPCEATRLHAISTAHSVLLNVVKEVKKALEQNVRP